MYFWENNARRALEFAQDLHSNPRKGKSPIKKPSILGAVIDLGYCLDLLESEFIGLIRSSYENLTVAYQQLNLTVPENSEFGPSKLLLIRKLDCAVIENLHNYRSKEKLRPFDSARGVFIEGDPLYPNAGFYEKSHIQLCIRNPNCIKGFFIPREEDAEWIIP